MVQHQGIDTMEQFYEWDERYLAIVELSTSYLDTPWDKKSLEFLRPIPSKLADALEMSPSPS